MNKVHVDHKSMGLVQTAIDNEISSADEIVSKMRILRSGIASKMRNIDSMADKLTPDIDRRYYYRTNDDIINIDNQKFRVMRRSYSSPVGEYRRRKRYDNYDPNWALNDKIFYREYVEVPDTGFYISNQ